MHTVIILNKHTSDLLKDFKFLFKPFADEGIISFCDWNESGTDINESVPDLYRTIKGKQEWRAMIVGTDSMSKMPGKYTADEKNPFDFPEDISEDECARESRIPLIRLTHMLGGYPVSSVKNFEKGYEYTDLFSGETHRIRESEITDDELYQLGQQYKENLKQIYMEVKFSEEYKAAQQEMTEKYAFSDNRPKELFLISTRKHRDDEEHIYASWKTPFEMESSNFSNRNKYPSICRFMCYGITNAENSMYMKELTEFWLSVLTVAINKIPSSNLQAYRLYRFGVKISVEEMENVLNSHLNKLESVGEFVRERLQMKTEYSFEEEEELVPNQKIPVTFEMNPGKELYISTNKIGLSRDCPQDELMFWDGEVREKQRALDKFLKAPRRSIDKSARNLKIRTESFYGDEYELDKFQVADLEERIEQLEQEVLICDTRHVIDENKTKKEMQDINTKVRKDIAARMRKGLVIKMAVSGMLIYLAGFFHYVLRALWTGPKEFVASLGVVLAATVVILAGELVMLFILRRNMIASMERFNDLMRGVISNVNASAKKFEEYFSAVCTFMKAQSIRSGIRLKNDSVSSEKFMLRVHKQAIKVSVERDEELAASYGVKRKAEVVKNITRFFNETQLPKDSSLYYFEVDRNNTGIPVNHAGDMIDAPYSFIERLEIEREDLYEDTKGDND